MDDHLKQRRMDEKIKDLQAWSDLLLERSQELQIKNAEQSKRVSDLLRRSLEVLAEAERIVRGKPKTK